MIDNLNTAILASVEAGKKILEIYHSEDFEVEIKKDNSPLTIADKVSHSVIMSYLSKTRIPILSEEGRDIPFGERKNWNELWIVDPIDGTKEFINRNGEFTINIALIKNDKLELGVIFLPVKGDLYFSKLSLGSFKINIELDSYKIENIIQSAERLPFQTDNKIFTIVASRSHMSKETENYISKMRKKHGSVNIIYKGSSLKLCMVAEGTANCYPRFSPTMEWDIAAGQAICEHAGFNVIDLENQTKMAYNKKNLINNWFLTY